MSKQKKDKSNDNKINKKDNDKDKNIDASGENKSDKDNKTSETKEKINDDKNKNKDKDKENEASKKKKFRFNAFDLCVLLSFIVIFSLLGMKLYEKRLKDLNANRDFYFKIEALGLDEDFETKNKISVGDEIRDSVRGFYYGKISKIKSMPAKKITEDNINGCYALTNVPNKIDLQVTVKSKANYSDKAICVENNPVRIGKLMSLKSKGYVIYGHIIDMQTEE